MASRLDVRLDPERRQRLEEMARDQGVPISDVIRSLIDDAYEGILRERRRKAVDTWSAWRWRTRPTPRP